MDPTATSPSRQPHIPISQKEMMPEPDQNDSKSPLLTLASLLVLADITR